MRERARRVLGTRRQRSGHVGKCRRAAANLNETRPRQALLSLCAYYLGFRSTMTERGDAVARFHLDNGARLDAAQRTRATCRPKAPNSVVVR